MKIKKLVTTAMLLAIATVLSFIQIVPLPFGGAITPVSMLPIIIIGYMYGIRHGLLAAFVYSLIQMIAGIGTISAFFLPGESQMTVWKAICVTFVDYIPAYTLLGFGALFKDKLKSRYAEICLGAVVSLSFRYMIHIISGAIFFGAWAEWFFSDSTGLSQIHIFENFSRWIALNVSGNLLSVIYSVIYNGIYMIPEIIITASVAPVILKHIKTT